MKKRKLILCAVFIFSLFIFSNCHTKRKGIVPCPSYGNIDNSIQNTPLVAEKSS